MSENESRDSEPPLPAAFAGAPPIIILGAHRSGTGAVTSSLHQLGLVIGRRRDENHESQLFQSLNRRVFAEAGASWDHPLPVRNLTGSPERLQRAVRRTRATLVSPRWIQYSARGFWPPASGPAAMRGPWGWKDPRNVFTLGMWLSLFPRARVVHVLRHGVDAALSLRRRELARAEAARRRSWLRRPLVARQRLPVPISERCFDLEGGFALWMEYLTEVRAFWPRLGNRAIELRFEDLLAEPVAQLTALSQVLGLDPDARQIARVAGRLNPGRALAFRSDPSLRDFSARHSEQLSRFGYAV